MLINVYTPRVVNKQLSLLRKSLFARHQANVGPKHKKICKFLTGYFLLSLLKTKKSIKDSILNQFRKHVNKLSVVHFQRKCLKIRLKITQHKFNPNLTQKWTHKSPICRQVAPPLTLFATPNQAWNSIYIPLGATVKQLLKLPEIIASSPVLTVVLARANQCVIRFCCAKRARYCSDLTSTRRFAPLSQKINYSYLNQLGSLSPGRLRRRPSLEIPLALRPTHGTK